MDFRRILITGGAGFVGSNLAVLLKRNFPELTVTALDNLSRRGSDLNLIRLDAHQVQFLHGDIRCTEDLENLPTFDLIIDCAAEPSVQAGTKGSPWGVFNTNLVGTINCLEAARRWGAAFVFLSTSRVYPMTTLNDLAFHEEPTRFCWEENDSVPGFSSHGIAEHFPIQGARSFYGASKLACELIVQEYVHNSGIRAIINRCGVLAGPWQMGKVDQGVVTLWVSRHHFGRPLRYTGFRGVGKQVRDVLHVEDLFDLLVCQMRQPNEWAGNTYNVGGGVDNSLSLLELTEHCQAATGQRTPITPEPETNNLDMRIYITDSRRAEEQFAWRPTRNVEQIVQDIHRWIEDEEEILEPVLG
jgi:CDP-paratose 2-epimerase